MLFTISKLKPDYTRVKPIASFLQNTWPSNPQNPEEILLGHS